MSRQFLNRRFSALGFQGDLPQLLQTIRTDPRFKFPGTESARDEYRKTLYSKMAKIEAHLPEMFNTFPKAKYEIREVVAGPGFFYSFPALDGSTPGIYYINLQSPSVTSMEVLAYHELLPGHHMNVALQQELRDAPTFRKTLLMTAHAEGWGMYAERLPSDPILGQSVVNDIGAY